MNTENQILGNEKQEKSIDRLLREAGKDRVVKEVLEGKKEVKRQYQFEDLPEFFNMLKPCERAENLITAVEKYGKFDEDTGMLEYDAKIYLDANAALALAYLVIGERELGYKLIQRIEEHIKFDDNTGLVNHDNGEDSKILTKDNVLLSLTYFACGMEEKALALIKKIEDNAHFRYFGDGGMLIENTFKEDIIGYMTDDSALLSLAYFAYEKGADALKLIKGIENHIGFDDDKELVIWRFSSSNDSYSDDNALLALAYFACGKEYDGLKLIEDIEKRIGFDKRTGLVKIGLSFSDHEPEPYDSLMLALAYMAKAAYEDKK